jgi:hypothetical protein
VVLADLEPELQRLPSAFQRASSGRVENVGGSRWRCLRLLLAADGLAGSGPWRGLMHSPRWLAALFVVLALAGCASVAAGPAQAPSAPYQQGDPRDTSGMH